MGRIIHIELTSTDPGSTAAFFTAAFGWETSESPLLAGYLMAATGAGSGIDGAIMSRDHQQQPVIAWLQVDDIAGACTAIEVAGGALAGKVHDLPGRGRVAYFTDPGGVVHGLMERVGR